MLVHTSPFTHTTGDYRQALQVMPDSELNEPSLASRVPLCRISIAHYVGFCYMMMRRYEDALRNFERALAFIQSIQQFHSRSFEPIARKADHLYALLAVVHTLLPQRLEDSVAKEMYKREGAEIEKIRNG